MYRYVKVNSHGMVTSDNYSTNKINDTDMILVDLSFDLTNKKYINGEWIDFIPEPEPKPPISEQEQQQLETTLNIEYLVCLADLGLI